jgi:hypothetical protein
MSLIDEIQDFNGLDPYEHNIQLILGIEEYLIPTGISPLRDHYIHLNPLYEIQLAHPIVNTTRSVKFEVNYFGRTIIPNEHIHETIKLKIHITTEGLEIILKKFASIYEFAENTNLPLIPIYILKNGTGKHNPTPLCTCNSSNTNSNNWRK